MALSDICLKSKNQVQTGQQNSYIWGNEIHLVRAETPCWPRATDHWSWIRENECDCIMFKNIAPGKVRKLHKTARSPQQEKRSTMPLSGVFQTGRATSRVLERRPQGVELPLSLGTQGWAKQSSVATEMDTVIQPNLRPLQLLCGFLDGIPNLSCHEQFYSGHLGLPGWRSGWGVCLPMQRTRVRALVWEDPTCRRATKPVSHNYWACASGACAPQQERPRWWEAHAPGWRVAPTCRNWREPSHRNEDPTQPK